MALLNFLHLGNQHLDFCVGIEHVIAALFVAGDALLKGLFQQHFPSDFVPGCKHTSVGLLFVFSASEVNIF